jgi:hypothetical protein
MKSRLATYMNLGRRILASTLLAAIVTVAAVLRRFGFS